MRFTEFLTEKAENHAVMAFGRMNPPTTGHEVLVNKVKDVAKSVGGSHHVILSHSQDTEKNPLSSEQKVKHAKRFFPGTNISTASKEKPTFLHHASELYKKGVTHLHMVAGSDRVEEYKKTLHKYNGVKDAHGHFNFKHIEVHSAGERDPDAEGTTGMSASKMRGHATSGNFKEFKKGIPKHVADHHAKELYNDVRKGMSIKEFIEINESFVELLNEGVHDESIFKAVFLAGGPGSGKDYVLSNTLDGHGLTEINSDKALEYLMDKEGLDKMMPASETEKRDLVRGRAKNITELRQRLALLGRNGLIINGTGDDVEKTKKIKDELEKLGYDTSMLLVNTRDEISAARNIERGQRGGRTVPETIRKEKWDNVQNARTEYAKTFGNNYMEFDNSEDLRSADPEIVREKKQELLQLFKQVKEFTAAPPQSPEAQFWVANEMDKKDTLEIPKDGAEKVPHSDAGAAEEARKLGLQYYGFGRYGKDGEVTHRSVHGSLVMVTKQEPKQPKLPTPGSSPISEDLRNWFDPKHPKGGWKRINSKGEAIGPCAREPGEAKPKCMSNEKRAKLSKKERASAVAAKRRHDPVADRSGKGGKPVNVSNFGKGKLSESITVSITGDTVEEVKDFFNNFNSPVETTEQYALSDSRNDLITLGKSMQPFGEKMENTTITNDMITNIQEEKKHNLLKDKNGTVRVFMLRAAAAKEAHTKQGTVLKHKNGYVVKLKEEKENVEASKRTIGDWIEESRKTWTGRSDPSTERGLLSESGTILATESGETSSGDSRRKISISEIRSKQKEKIVESIDKNIEPGLSMATSGENLGRSATKVKSLKKPLEELTGDETTYSIGAQKEDELKKKGIDLKTFKSKKFIG
jgi:hypothetical protein